MAQAKDLEMWRNVSAGRVVLKKYNTRGDLGDEMVMGGRTFTLTPVERRINQEMAANEDLDVFKNGLLSPVRLIETEEDTKEIASNPNLIAEADMTSLFKVSAAQFKKRLGEIKNPVTLSRLLEVAKEVDAPVSKVEAVQSRLHEVAPQLFSEVTSSTIGSGPSEITATTPR